MHLEMSVWMSLHLIKPNDFIEKKNIEKLVQTCFTKGFVYVLFGLLLVFVW